MLQHSKRKNRSCKRSKSDPKPVTAAQHVKETQMSI